MYQRRNYIKISSVENQLKANCKIFDKQKLLIVKITEKYLMSIRKMVQKENTEIFNEQKIG